MGLISGLFSFPLAPVRASMWIAEQLKKKAEEEHYDPTVVRRELAEVEDAHAAGEISDEQRDELQEQLLQRLFESQNRSGKK